MLKSQIILDGDSSVSKQALHVIRGYTENTASKDLFQESTWDSLTFGFWVAVQPKTKLSVDELFLIPWKLHTADE